MTCCIHHNGSNELLLYQIGQELINKRRASTSKVKQHDKVKVQDHTRSQVAGPKKAAKKTTTTSSIVTR
jgi:hypothetical protein